MKRNKQNKIIEIAISEYISTSFALKLEMSPQEKIDKNIAVEANELLLLNNQKNETRIENFGSEII